MKHGRRHSLQSYRGQFRIRFHTFGFIHRSHPPVLPNRYIHACSIDFQIRIVYRTASLMDRYPTSGS